MSKKFYAAEWSASHPVSAEHCVQVVAFHTVRERHDWVMGGRSGSYYGDGHGLPSSVRSWSREAITRRRAERYLGAIMRAAYGPGGGREAIRHVRAE